MEVNAIFLAFAILAPIQVLFGYLEKQISNAGVPYLIKVIFSLVFFAITSLMSILLWVAFSAVYAFFCKNDGLCLTVYVNLVMVIYALLNYGYVALSIQAIRGKQTFWYLWLYGITFGLVVMFDVLDILDIQKEWLIDCLVAIRSIVTVIALLLAPRESQNFKLATPEKERMIHVY